MRCVGSNEPRSPRLHAAPVNRISGNFKTRAITWCAWTTCSPVAVVASVLTFPARSRWCSSEEVTCRKSISLGVRASVLAARSAREARDSIKPGVERSGTPEPLGYKPEPAERATEQRAVARFTGCFLSGQRSWGFRCASTQALRSRSLRERNSTFAD
jgi:hypothetical protein